MFCCVKIVCFLVPPAILMKIFLSFWLYLTACHCSPLVFWNTSTTTLLSGGDRYLWHDYDSSSRYPNCIWLFGGANDGSSIYCYNIISNTLTTHDTISIGTGYNSVHKSGVLISNDISDYLYWLHRDGHLYKYDIINKNVTLFQDYDDIHLSFSNPCMLKHPFSNKYLYVVNWLSNEYWFYNFENDYWKKGPNILYSRSYPSCIVNSYDANNPYLYVISGWSNYIERLNLNKDFDTNGNGWESLGDVLNGINGVGQDYSESNLYAVTSYDEYIFIICGHYESTWQDDIVILDVINGNVTFDSYFLIDVYGSSAQLS